MHADLLIADDHPLFRRGIADLINKYPEFNIVAEAETGADALIILEQTKIDIALLDIQMPGYNGIEMLELILNRNIDISVILLTMHDEPVFAQRAFELGAKGYLLKEEPESQIISCINRVLDGQIFSSLDYNNNSKSCLGISILSKSENEIFHLVGTGKSSIEISDLLNKSARTIDNHRSNITSKLGLKGPNSLLKYAIAYNKII